MSVFIDKEAAEKILYDGCHTEDGKETLDDVIEMWHMIQAIPAADVRKVVLCGECKHKGWVQEPEHGKSVDYCRVLERCVDKRFFCAAGERADCNTDGGTQ